MSRRRSARLSALSSITSEAPSESAPASPEAKSAKTILNKVSAIQYQYPAIIDPDTNKSSSSESGDDTGSGRSTPTGTESPKNTASGQKAPANPERRERYQVLILPPQDIEALSEDSDCTTYTTASQQLIMWAAHLWYQKHASVSLPPVIIKRDYNREECKNGCVGVFHCWGCNKGWIAAHAWVDVYCDSGCMTCPEVSGVDAPTTIPRFISGGSPTDRGHCYECAKKEKEEIL
ncbi:hypothetical protein OCU04_006658 [Sclerotinia nivalis]|uniref:Uncharacterized protein n=1 Tax=Sclerotinia nivalis TaxID=352851 RepID=A0A9X0AK77_9HELO|nr:hypothetical protein OCU04_006658 [Sclerotinia nivalis]